MSSLTLCNSLAAIDGRLAGAAGRPNAVAMKAPAAVKFATFPSVFHALKVSSTPSTTCIIYKSLFKNTLRSDGSRGVKSVAVTANASEEWVEEDEEEEEEEEEEELGSENEGSYGGGSPFVEPPDEAKLFVGNLPFSVDPQKLGELFEGAGEVLDVNIIMNRETGNSRGFGFVTMSSVEEAEKGIENFDQFSFDGRLLSVKKAAPRGSRLERPTEAGSPNKVYVGNLPWQADDNTLLQIFSEHGKVLEARIVYDRETGRSRGFGFVTFSSESEVSDAIAALDGTEMEGRPLRVNVAENRPRRGLGY